MESLNTEKTKIQDLVTIEEYSLIIGKTARTVYNWINEKRLITHNLFGKTLINKYDRPKD
jgi:hypothetical protein